MQTDTWLTDTSHSDRCPLCSQPLAAGSNICPACGFAAHEPARNAASPRRASSSGQANPVTPIPARASALRVQHAPGGPAHHSASSQSAGQPAPSTAERARGRQYISPKYEAASSLSSLSLIISETPTAPPRTTRRLPHPNEHPEYIDEIDTVPPVESGVQKAQPGLPESPVPPGAFSLSLDEIDAPGLALTLSETTPPISLTSIDEIDTIPETGQPSSRALQTASPATRTMAVNAASWSASAHSTTSSLATRWLTSRAPRRHPRSFNLLDRMRWWLLRPGHIEFLLWLIGSLLLFSITFLLLLAIVLNVMAPGRQSWGNSHNSTTVISVTSTRTATLHLELPGKAAFTPGAELHLQGQGFHPHSQVVFLLDGRWPLLNQSGQAASVQADASGHFAADLWLGRGANWSAGPHQILAREADNGHQAAIPITINAAPATSVPGNSGPRNTPAPPVYPTAAPAHPTPTPTPAHPTPTPTPASSPTASPTGTGTPVGTATPSQGKTATSSSLENKLNSTNESSLFTHLAHLNPLIWFIGSCYLLSMLLMGLAGVLRRRRR